MPAPPPPPVTAQPRPPSGPTGPPRPPNNQNSPWHCQPATPTIPFNYNGPQTTEHFSSRPSSPPANHVSLHMSALQIANAVGLHVMFPEATKYITQPVRPLWPNFNTACLPKRFTTSAHKVTIQWFCTTALESTAIIAFQNGILYYKFDQNKHHKQAQSQGHAAKPLKLKAMEPQPNNGINSFYFITASHHKTGTMGKANPNVLPPHQSKNAIKLQPYIDNQLFYSITAFWSINLYSSSSNKNRNKEIIKYCPVFNNVCKRNNCKGSTQPLSSFQGPLTHVGLTKWPIQQGPMSYSSNIPHTSFIQFLLHKAQS